MDFSDKVPMDGEVFLLSDGDYHVKAEFVDTKGSDGAERRVAWRLYDRLHRGVLITEAELKILCRLMSNYRGREDIE